MKSHKLLGRNMAAAASNCQARFDTITATNYVLTISQTYARSHRIALVPQVTALLFRKSLERIAVSAGDFAVSFDDPGEIGIMRNKPKTVDARGNRKGIA